MLTVMGLNLPGSDAQTVLEFDAVSFAAPDGSEILRKVSLKVDFGQITVVVGPSGVGKSTLARLGNRLDLPSEGFVRFRGSELGLSDPRWLRRRIGMVFQRPVLFAGTVRSNLIVADPQATDATLEAILRRVGLDGEILDRKADELSGGEAQRLCIARTLLTKPEVLLMDEPTSALDPENRLGIERLTRELVDNGMAVLWITHDLAQASRIADRIEVLVEGRNATSEESADYLKQSDFEEGQ